MSKFFIFSQGNVRNRQIERKPFSQKDREHDRRRKRERERDRKEERERKQNNVAEQLRFHFKKCGDSGGPGGRQYIISWEAAI